MTDKQIVDRAVTLSEMAPDSSVTMAVLAGREGRFSQSPPLADPPVTYLEGAEAPAFVLTNKKRGIGLGTKRNTVSPDRDNRTVIVVTGRRTLCLVGQQSGDEVIEIPHTAVAEARYKTGFRAHRLVLNTPRKQYHCWVNRKTETRLLADVTAFIEARQQESPEEIEGDEDANRIRYRGQPVNTTPKETSDEDDDDENKQTVMYRGNPVDKPY